MDVAGIIQTVLTAHQVGATQQQRTAEVQLFNQLKEGEIRSAAAAGSELTQSTQPLEAQILGYGLLQFLVGARWEDFPIEDKNTIPTVSYALLRQNAQGGAPWVIRSKAAALLALAIKRSGPEFLKTGLAQLLEEAQTGPTFQEAACLVLRYLADEILQFTDDVHGDQLRQLVTTLTSVLGPVLQFVERTIESNFPLVAAKGSAAAEAAPHIAAVHAALGATEAYVEWAPIGTFRESGLVVACGYLLRDNEFKGPACQVILKLAGRRLTVDENYDGFAVAMQEAAEALIQTANALLAPEASPDKELDFEGENEEFGLLICESMATLGTGHISQAVPDAARRMVYLQCMLAFAQHSYLLLADKALVLWAKLLQDAANAAVPELHKSGAAISANAAAAAASGGGGGGGEPQHARSAHLPPEAVVALMELAAEHLRQRNPHLPQAEDEIPPYFDTFEDYKEFMIGYRFKLSNIVKAAAAVLPQQALQAAGARLHAGITAAAAAGNSSSSISSSSTTGGPALENARVLLESAVVFTVSACKAVWEAAAAVTDEADRSARTAAIVAATEPMLQSLLALHVSDALLLQSQAKGLEAFSRLIAVKWELLPGVVSRIFELLVGCVPLDPQEQIAPPGKPLPGWRDGLQARGDVAAILLEYSKAAPQAFLPHLEAIARRLTELWDAAQIRPGERNAITEALLSAALSGAPELQISLLEWALSPVRAVWTSPEWHSQLSQPQAFVEHYVPVTTTSTTTTTTTEDSLSASQQAATDNINNSANVVVVIGCQAGRWALYHQVHLLERIIRRMHGIGSSSSTTLMSSTPTPTTLSYLNPMTPHMAWIIPSLCQLVSCLNAVHTPAGRAALGLAANAAEISLQERSLYLRRGPAGRRHIVAAAASAAAGGNSSASDNGDSGDYASVGGTSIGSLRAWLRHLREFAYHSLGMFPACVPAALELPALHAGFASSSLAYVESLSHPHVRVILRHLTIPFVKTVPASQLVDWTLPQLALLAPHMQHRLAAAWSELMQITPTTPTPAIDAAGGGGNMSGATNDEIINERMVRELTQEYADLLRDVAGRMLEDQSITTTTTTAATATTTTLDNASRSHSHSQSASQHHSTAIAAGLGKSTRPAAHGPTLLQLLLEREPAAGIAAAAAAVHGMQLPDEGAFRFAMFCRALVALAPRDPHLYAYVGSEVLRAAITSLASEVMSTHQADILGLIRNILNQQLGDVHSAVHGVVASLPGVTPEKQSAFMQAFQSTGSEKEQRNAVKKFLVEACGRGSFAALSDWRAPLTLPAGALMNRGGRAAAAAAAAAAGGGGGGVLRQAEVSAADEQLQGEITRALFEE